MTSSKYYMILFLCVLIAILWLFQRTLIEGLDVSYNSKELDTVYHKSAIDIINESEKNGLFSFNKTVVYDPSGGMKLLTTLPASTSPFFYEKDDFKYGSPNYYPTYEDSVILSRTHSPYKMVRPPDPIIHDPKLYHNFAIKPKVTTYDKLSKLAFSDPN